MRKSQLREARGEVIPGVRSSSHKGPRMGICLEHKEVSEGRDTQDTFREVGRARGMQAVV